MRVKKFILIITLIGFLILGLSGLILILSFKEDVFRKVLGFNKSDWLSFHMIVAIADIILVSYHVGSRWTWVEKYLFDYNKMKISSAIRKRQISNFFMMLVFSVSLLSGFLAWIMGGECGVCLEIHQYTGISLWIVFIYHLYLHRKSFF